MKSPAQAGHVGGAPSSKGREALLLLREILAWLHQNLFSTWYNVLLTIGALALVWWALDGLLTWGVFQATLGLGLPQAQWPQSCKVHSGACWTFIREMWALFMVGVYPAEGRWRPLVALLLVVAAGLAAFWRPVRQHPAYPWAWAVSALVALLLVRGLADPWLPVVDTRRWGGLMLTLILTVFSAAVALPLGVVLALGRRSHMPAIRALCVAYIELIRGVPLITVLFMASVMMPLFFPSGFNLDNVLRAQIGITLFSAAYLAEVVRGGLQGVPHGQEEAARALGLGTWPTLRHVVLPQALRIVIPSLTNILIALLKNTSLVYIVGLYDLLGMAQQAIANPRWLGRLIEAYVFIGSVYLVLCLALSRVSQHLERRLRARHA